MPTSVRLRTSRGAVLLAALLSAAAGAAWLAMEIWWWEVETDALVGAVLPAVAVTVAGVLVAVAPIAVGLCAARRVGEGWRVTARASAALAAAFTLPGALLLAVAQARPYVLTPAMKAELLTLFSATELEAKVAESPSAVGVGLIAFAGTTVAAAVLWVAIVGLTMVLGHHVQRRKNARASRLPDENLEAINSPAT